jgi:hypothetical protein
MNGFRLEGHWPLERVADGLKRGPTFDHTGCFALGRAFAAARDLDARPTRTTTHDLDLRLSSRTGAAVGASAAARVGRQGRRDVLNSLEVARTINRAMGFRSCRAEIGVGNGLGTLNVCETLEHSGKPFLLLPFVICKGALQRTQLAHRLFVQRLQFEYTLKVGFCLIERAKRSITLAAPEQGLDVCRVNGEGFGAVDARLSAGCRST